MNGQRPQMGIPGLQGPYVGTPNPYMAGMVNKQMLGNMLGGAQGLGGGLATQWQAPQMSELAKLQRDANPKDIDDIERLANLLPQLAPAYRQKAIDQTRKKIGIESYPLLDYYILRAGPGPAFGLETWRMGGKPATEAAKTALMQQIMGTTAGAPWELALSQLPPEQRAAAMAQRVKRIEPRYPGAHEVGRTLIPTGRERVLTEAEAARQRVRETPGGWEKVTGITGKWTPEQFAFEKEESIALAQAQGILDQRGVAAAKTFIDRTRVPEWYSQLPETMRSRVGLKTENGIVVSDLSKDPTEALSQLNLRSVFSQREPTLAEIKGMEDLDTMRIVVFGSEMLSQKELTAISRDESSLPSWLIGFVKEPLTSKDQNDPAVFNMIKKLLRYFAPQQIAAMLSMAYDRSIREGIIAEVGYKQTRGSTAANDVLARLFTGSATRGV